MTNARRPARRERDQVVRGFFGLGEAQHVVEVTSSADFRVYVWARNIETVRGGVQILTPPSQFRGRNAGGGDTEGLVLEVPPQTGIDLGCIGGQGSEVLEFSNSGGGRVTVFLTVVTAPSATVRMTPR